MLRDAKHISQSQVLGYEDKTNVNEFSGGVGKGLAQTQLTIPFLLSSTHQQQGYQTSENTQYSYKTLLQKGC